VLVDVPVPVPTSSSDPPTSLTLTVITWLAALEFASVALTVAVYVALLSKSGAATNVSTPPDVIANSEPDIVNVIAAKSVAVTVPIAV
jgi:hypothetical protein